MGIITAMDINTLLILDGIIEATFPEYSYIPSLFIAGLNLLQIHHLTNTGIVTRL